MAKHSARASAGWQCCVRASAKLCPLRMCAVWQGVQGHLAWHRGGHQVHGAAQQCRAQARAHGHHGGGHQRSALTPKHPAGGLGQHCKRRTGLTGVGAASYSTLCPCSGCFCQGTDCRFERNQQGRPTAFSREAEPCPYRPALCCPPMPILVGRRRTRTSCSLCATDQQRRAGTPKAGQVAPSAPSTHSQGSHRRVTASRCVCD